MKKGGFFRLFCMAVLLCSKKCKPAWRNDLAINIKLTAATYGGFHTYFKYQTENYDTVISALAESSMSILGTAGGVGEERRRHVTCNEITIMIILIQFIANTGKKKTPHLFSCIALGCYQ